MSQQVRDPVGRLERRAEELETALDALTYEVADLNHRLKSLAPEDGDETERMPRREVGVGLDDPDADARDRGRGQDRGDELTDDGIYVA